jgi:hypothetical protein
MRVSFLVRQMLRLMSDSISRNIERLSYAQRLLTHKLVCCTIHSLTRYLTHVIMSHTFARSSITSRAAGTNSRRATSFQTRMTCLACSTPILACS